MVCNRCFLGKAILCFLVVFSGSTVFAHDGETHDEGEAEVPTDAAHNVTGSSSTMMHTGAHVTYFVVSNQVTLLIQQASTTSIGGYFSGLIVTFFITLSAEFLSAISSRFSRRCAKSCTCGLVCTCSLLHAAHYGLHLLVMLLAMSFNVGIFLAILAAVAISHFIRMRPFDDRAASRPSPQDSDSEFGSDARSSSPRHRRADDTKPFTHDVTASVGKIEVVCASSPRPGRSPSPCGDHLSQVHHIIVRPSIGRAEDDSGSGTGCKSFGSNASPIGRRSSDLNTKGAPTADSSGHRS